MTLPQNLARFGSLAGSQPKGVRDESTGKKAQGKGSVA